VSSLALALELSSMSRISLGARQTALNHTAFSRRSRLPDVGALRYELQPS
jgi:hypothetical protein